MATIRPPSVPVSAIVQNHADLADMTYDGLGRNAALAAWKRQMVEPLPDSSAITDELRSWSGSFGSVDWFQDRYGATSALLLTSPAITSTESTVWSEIAKACREFIEPFARYSAGWVDSLKELRPDGLSGDAGRGLREIERRAPVAVRQGMRPSRKVLGVIETHHTARSFIGDQRPRHRTDTEAALKAYIAGLERLVAGEIRGTGRLPDGDDAVVRAHRDDVATEFAAIVESGPSPEDLAEYRRQATEMLARVVADFTIHRADAPFIAEAYERVHRTYTNRLRAGRDLAGTEPYLAWRLSATRKDAARRTATRREEPLEVSDDSNVRRSYDQGVDHVTAGAAAHAAGRARLDAIIDQVLADPTLRSEGSLIWEATVAVDILNGVGGIETSSDLKEYVTQRWSSEIPAFARSRSASTAATDVNLVLRYAAGRAEQSTVVTKAGVRR